jgi:L-fuconolactonase
MPEISRRALLGAAAASPLLSAMNDYRIIDPHVHVWKHDPGFPFAEGARPPERDATPDMLLELMKANGVERTVIIQVIHYRYDNGYLAGVLKRPTTCPGSPRRAFAACG